MGPNEPKAQSLANRWSGAAALPSASPARSARCSIHPLSSLLRPRASPLLAESPTALPLLCTARFATPASSRMLPSFCRLLRRPALCVAALLVASAAAPLGVIAQDSSSSTGSAPAATTGGAASSSTGSAGQGNSDNRKQRARRTQRREHTRDCAPALSCNQRDGGR